MQTFTRDEVSWRNRQQDAAIIIDNVVYDVTEFLDHHPGGVEVLLSNAGKDASRCFADVGHSDDAKLWRAQYKVGEVVVSERWEVITSPSTDHCADADEHALQGFLNALMPPLLLTAVSFLAYNYLFP